VFERGGYKVKSVEHFTEKIEKGGGHGDAVAKEGVTLTRLHCAGVSVNGGAVASQPHAGKRVVEQAAWSLRGW
jgi:hypothetical protein